ncbi:MAG: MinD/ParA family protein [Spirochaetes bacterium]|nr:MinD/ParA family protein [Spirochaetota bacterium]
MADQADELRKMMSGPVQYQQRVIAVTSGKGGVGKTNVAINLGIALGRYNKKVIVMDADLGLANVNVILGKIPEFNLFHVMKGLKKMRDIVINTNYGIRFIAGASGFSQLANLSEESRNNLVNGLEELNDADIIIIDTGAGVSNNVLSFVLAADEVVIVTTPEPTAITDAYGIIKAISSEATSPDLKLIINRVKSVTEARKVSERVVNIASQFLNMKVNNLGFVFEDEIVSQAVIRQLPFMELDPKSRAAMCLDHLAQRLLKITDKEFKEPKGLKGFFKNIAAFYAE